MIIPNKDHSAGSGSVHPVHDGAARRTRICEFIVIENNSTEKETFAYYEKIQKEFPQVHVVKWEREFNYSAINNFGAQFAKGEYLLLPE